MPALEQLPTLYSDGRYLEKNPTWHAEDASWKAKQVLKALQHLNIVPKTVCDIGCGAGEVIRCLADQMREPVFHGYETSPQAFSMARSRETDRCRFFKFHGIQQLEPVAYDLVMALDVVEHVEDCHQFLRDLKNVARYKLLHVPLELSVLGVAANQPLWARRQAGHLHVFSMETLLCLLVECGLEPLHRFYTPAFSASPADVALRQGSGRGMLKTVLLRPLRTVTFSTSPKVCARYLGGCSLIILAI